MQLVPRVGAAIPFCTAWYAPCTAPIAAANCALVAVAGVCALSVASKFTGATGTSVVGTFCGAATIALVALVVAVVCVVVCIINNLFKVFNI